MSEERPIEFAAYCAWLRNIGRRPPSAAHRRELHEALASKIDGVVVSAAHGLCGVGDRESVDAVRRRLEEYILLPRRESTIAGLLNALGPVITREHYVWAIELYDRYPDDFPYPFWPFFNALPSRDLCAALDECTGVVSSRTIKDLRNRTMHATMQGAGRRGT